MSTMTFSPQVIVRPGAVIINDQINPVSAAGAPA